MFCDCEGIWLLKVTIRSQARHCRTSVASTRQAVPYLARWSARVRRCAYGRHRCPQDTNMLQLLKAKFVAYNGPCSKSLNIAAPLLSMRRW